MATDTTSEPTRPQPKWKPISATDRRVLGVMVEKAKTTPDQYPMTLNGICTGANQKSNRFPQMELELEDVEESLDRLRALGAVAEVQGNGRVNKYRHFMYEWLGVDKVELAVMAELLLRGAQTEGELRGRAARMDPIADLSALRPILESLKQKGLVISLTNEGRGHVVTHALYEPRELEKVRAEHGSSAAGPVTMPQSTPLHSPPASSASARPAATPQPRAADPTPAASASPPAVQHATADMRALGREVASLRDQVAQLRGELDEATVRFQQVADEVREIKSALGG